MSDDVVETTMHRAYRGLRRAAKKHIKQPLINRYAVWIDRRVRTTLFGELNDLVPPVSLMYDGPADLHSFKSNGDEFYRLLRDKCGLLPSHAMLDIGCGTGRKTLPLLDYLNPSGTYEGVDIVRSGIEWCKTRITPRYPYFRFQLMDVHNGLYNPTSEVNASEYRFPFSENTFDVILLGSVFTHTLMEDTCNYLSEIKRMLKPGGRCLISYFLLNEESERLIALGKAEYAFLYPVGPCKVMDPDNPERAVAYKEEDIVAAYRERSLNIKDQVYYGSWCGREKFLSFQDLVVGAKV